MAAFFAYFKLAGSSSKEQRASVADNASEKRELPTKRLSLAAKRRKEFLGAAKANNLKAVEHYLENRLVSIYCVNAKRQTAAHIAIENNNLPLLRLLLKKDIAALVGAEDKKCRTPLHLAASLGRFDIVRFLVEECKLPANLVNRADVSVLYMTVAYGEYQTAVYLVERGADVNLGTFFDDTPLHVAVRHDYLKIVQYLVDKGNANAKARNAAGDTALHEAVRNKNMNTVKYLIEECKVSPLVENAEGENALYIAMHEGCEPIVEYLVETCNLGRHRDVILEYIDEIRLLRRKEIEKAEKKRAKKTRKLEKQKYKNVDEKKVEHQDLPKTKLENGRKMSVDFERHLRSLKTMIECEKVGDDDKKYNPSFLKVFAGASEDCY